MPLWPPSLPKEKLTLPPLYLAMVWQLLEQSKEEVGPTVKLQAMWRELPAPKANQPDAAGLDLVTGCVRMRDFVRRIRRHTEYLFNTPARRVRTSTRRLLLCGETARLPRTGVISTAPRCVWRRTTAAGIHSHPRPHLRQG